LRKSQPDFKDKPDWFTPDCEERRHPPAQRRNGNHTACQIISRQCNQKKTAGQPVEQQKPLK
jgi:hypothetical protein